MMDWFFSSLRGYRIEWLPRDLVAGLMLSAIAIPGQLATARLAGMPPQTGLYAFAAGSLAFAAFGANPSYSPNQLAAMSFDINNQYAHTSAPLGGPHFRPYR
jgi:MFS superfamily sulfate permease-like transporter